jgi:hypothetical protein
MKCVKLCGNNAAEEREMEVLKAQVQHLYDLVAAYHNRGYAVADELEALRKENAALRKDNAELIERVQILGEPITEPPGIADHAAAAPGGELHDLPPKDEGDLPEPPLMRARA